MSRRARRRLSLGVTATLAASLVSALVLTGPAGARHDRPAAQRRGFRGQRPDHPGQPRHLLLRRRRARPHPERRDRGRRAEPSERQPRAGHALRRHRLRRLHPGSRDRAGLERLRRLQLLGEGHATPASTIEYEIKDGGTDGEHSELWQGFFTDDSTGWKQIKEPFTSFVHRTDYIPPDSPTDGNLDLDLDVGLRVNVPANSQGDLTFDDFAVYGTPAPKLPKVAASRSVYLVDAGQTAHVPVTLTTADGQPTTDDATVDWTLDDGTADRRHRLHRRLRHADLPGRHRLGHVADHRRAHAGRHPTRPWRRRSRSR